MGPVALLQMLPPMLDFFASGFISERVAELILKLPQPLPLSNLVECITFGVFYPVFRFARFKLYFICIILLICACIVLSFTLFVRTTPPAHWFALQESIAESTS